jgi:hypothetical protein
MMDSLQLNEYLRGELAITKKYRRLEQHQHYQDIVEETLEKFPDLDPELIKDTAAEVYKNINNGE